MEAVHIRKKFKKHIDDSQLKSHTVLHLAALLSNVTEVTDLLDKGHDVDTAVSSGTSEGSTALHIATQFEHTVVIKVLLERGADFTLENVAGDTPLHIACRQGFTNIVKLYFAALCTACSRLNRGIAQALAETKLPVDNSILRISERCSDAFKLLKFALHFRLSEVVELLVNHGIDPEARDSNGMSALHYLARELSGCGGTNLNYYAMSKLRRALREFTEREVGFYIRTNFEAITKLFINPYENTKNPLDNYGRSPLSYLYQGFVDQTDSALSRMELFSVDTRRTHASMYKAREHLIHQLLRVSSISAILPGGDTEGNTILHLVAAAYPNCRAEQEADAVIAAYLANGGDVDARSRAGSTALHRCIRRDGTPVTEVLLRHGADVNATDAAGATAYSLAREWQPFWSFGCMSLLSYLRRLAVLGAALCPRNRRLWERDEGIARLAVPRVQAMHCTAEQCGQELGRMAAERVDEFTTLRDLLDRRPHDLLHRTRNEKLAGRDFLTEYPIYGYMLRNKMDRARWRAALVRKAKETLTAIRVFGELPDDCLHEILSHFDIVQLKALVEG